MSDNKHLPLKVLAIGAGVVVCGLISTGLWMASHPSAAPLQGQVEARIIEVAPKIAGRIAAVHVREGDAVCAGDVLADIDIPELTAKLGQVKAQQAAAEARSRLVEEGARTEQIDAARAQYERAAAGLNLARKSFARVHTLFTEGLVSAQKHDEAQAALENALNQTRAAKSQFDMARNGSRSDEKVAALALAQQAAEGVAEVTSLAAEAKLRAPRAGEVSRIVLHAGEVTPAGFALVTLIDHDDKWVTFNVREDELKSLTVGARIEGDVPALGRKLAFEVYWISPRADYATWRSTRQSTGYDVRTFEVRARPVQSDVHLRPGMSVLVER